ncbi:MAG TPA: outer membrane beta-barrel protein [Burkholderiales bacterium]|nr:outer membrane beta-barrel protein [Burkholderiales bacterium]
MALAAALLGATLPAAAQQSAFYAGVSAGLTDGSGCSGFAGVGLLSCDDRDTGMKIFGGMNFTRNFAAEIGWVDLGTLDASGAGGTAHVSVDGFQAAGLGILPLSPDFRAFGKLGLYLWDASASGPGATGGNGTDFMFGGGVLWSIAPRFELRGEWERYNTDEADVNLYSVGVQYRF